MDILTYSSYGGVFMGNDLVKLGEAAIKELSPKHFFDAANKAYKEHHDYELKKTAIPIVAGVVTLGMGMVYKIADKITDKDKSELQIKYGGAQLSIKGKNYKK